MSSKLEPPRRQASLEQLQPEEPPEQEQQQQKQAKAVVNWREALKLKKKQEKEAAERERQKAEETKATQYAHLPQWKQALLKVKLLSSPLKYSDWEPSLVIA